MKASELIAPGWGTNSPIQVIGLEYPNRFVIQLPDGRIRELTDLSSGSATNLVGIPCQRIEEIYSQADAWRPFVNYGYFHPEREKLAERLLRMAGFEDRGTVYRASTGTLAGTTAIKLAWLCLFNEQSTAQRTLALAPRGSYFGHDPCTLAAGYWCGSGDHDEGDSYNSYYLPNEIASNFHHLPSPASGIPLAESLEQALAEHKGRVAALMLEPVQFVGATTPTPNYYEGVMDVARQHDILVIADECATFGRFGSWLASRRFGLEPDIYTIGKGLSNSYEKVAAVLVSPEVSERIRANRVPEAVKVMFGSTLDWMPRDAFVANAVLDEVEEHGLLQRGDDLAKQLQLSLEREFHGVAGVSVRSAGGWSTVSFADSETTGGVRRALMKEHGLYGYRSGLGLNLLGPLVGSDRSHDEIARAVAESYSATVQ